MKKLRYSLPLIILILSSTFYFGFVKIGLPLTTKTIIRPYPELTNPKEITLTCDYQGKKLSVNETLYGSLAEYYKTDPKKYLAYYENNNKDFVFAYSRDNTVDNLVSKIQNVATQNILDKDQTLDLAGCLMQSIPYDQKKAEKILSNNKNYLVAELVPRFPYETLYDFTGVCTDKSYLGSMVATKLGYSNALLSFDSQRHLSLGVLVPEKYGQLGTSYGILELTGSGFLVGDIPQIKRDIGLAENSITNVPEVTVNNDLSGQAQLATLANVSRIEKISDGLFYSRVVERSELKKQLEVLYKALQTKKESVSAAQNNITTMEVQVKQAENYYLDQKTRASYSSYLETYNKYQQTLNEANNVIYDYNNTIKKYNQLVEYYKNF